MIATASRSAAKVDPVAYWLSLFVEPDQVTELRAVDVVTPSYRRPHIVSGFFDGRHLEEMAHAALRLGPIAQGVYFIPNPLEPALLARRCNRVAEAKEDELGKDFHVKERRWLLVDCDPVRPVSGVSATEAEKMQAKVAANRVRIALEGRFDDPVIADSGNGYHLLYRLRGVPVTDGGLVRSVLAGLAARFDTEAVKIDTAVFNPARVVKLYGTPARKGDHTPDRPHRTSRVLTVPDWIKTEEVV